MIRTHSLEAALDADLERVQTGLERAGTAAERQEHRKREQRKTLTRWVNGKLKATGKKPVADVVHAFRDGVGLAALLEALYTDVHGLYDSMKLDHDELFAMKIQNVKSCFRVIEEYDLKTTGLAPIDFVQEKSKFVGTFCWELMRKVERLPKISQDSDKIPSKLLAWLNGELGEPWLAAGEAPVALPDDFRSGRVLCSLFESRHPIVPSIGEDVSPTERNEAALAAFRSKYGICEVRAVLGGPGVGWKHALTLSLCCGVLCVVLPNKARGCAADRGGGGGHAEFDGLSLPHKGRLGE